MAKVKRFKSAIRPASNSRAAPDPLVRGKHAILILLSSCILMLSSLQVCHAEDLEWRQRQDLWCVISSERQACLPSGTDLIAVFDFGAELHFPAEYGRVIVMFHWIETPCTNSPGALDDTFELTARESIGTLELQEYTSQVGRKPSSQLKTFLVLAPDEFMVHFGGLDSDQVRGFARDFAAQWQQPVN